MRKILLVIALILAVAMMAGSTIGACGEAKATTDNAAATKASSGSKPQAPEVIPAVATTGEQVVVLNVSKMSGDECVGKVTKSLAAVEGVADVTVNREKGTALVKYDAAKVRPEMLTAAVVKAGYLAEVVPASPATPVKDETKSGCDAAKKGCDPRSCPIKMGSKP